MNPNELTTVELEVLCELDWVDAKSGLPDIRGELGDRLGDEVELILSNTFRIGWAYAMRRWNAEYAA